jgi:hypothetical protein
MNKEERSKAIEKIQSDVEDIKRDVALIIQHLLVPPFLPGYTPYPPGNTPPVKCQKCGMEVKGVMGYVCTDTHCPSGRGVSKIVTSGYTPWQSYNEPLARKSDEGSMDE